MPGGIIAKLSCSPRLVSFRRLASSKIVCSRLRTPIREGRAREIAVAIIGRGRHMSEGVCHFEGTLLTVKLMHGNAT